MKLDDIPREILAQNDEMRSLRRDIHAHPELGFQENRTSALVAAKLALWGWEVHSGIAGTGVVARMRRGSSDRSIGLRADMDALPIREGTSLAYASVHTGCMHACGHDGHTAMLLGAARHLAAHGRFDGTVHLIFQPAEEGLGGGRRMVEEGLFERFPCDAVFAMHNVPGLPAGKLGFRSGPFMASSDGVEIIVHGKGGHGGVPSQTVDPIVAGSAIVMALQTVVSRNLASTDSAVVTVGVFQAGERANVIPDTARLSLTVRTHDPAVRERVLERIRGVAEGQAATFGARAEVRITPQYPVVVNHPAETAFVRQVALDWRGPQGVLDELPMQTGAEDFAYMLQARPGCYFVIGNGAPEDTGAPQAPLHNPGYDFNDTNLPIGSAFWTRLVHAWLAPEAA